MKVKETAARVLIFCLISALAMGTFGVFGENCQMFIYDLAVDSRTHYYEEVK